MNLFNTPVRRSVGGGYSICYIRNKKKTNKTKMKNKKLTALQSIKLGFKRGWQTPTLPDHLLALEKKTLY
jgi:hypothetical protein